MTKGLAPINSKLDGATGHICPVAYQIAILKATGSCRPLSINFSKVSYNCSIHAAIIDHKAELAELKHSFLKGQKNRSMAY